MRTTHKVGSDHNDCSYNEFLVMRTVIDKLGSDYEDYNYNFSSSHEYCRYNLSCNHDHQD